MAVIMTSQDYYDSALKHLHACKTLRDSIGRTTDDKSIFCSIYYISGYIFECLINYAIYHFAGWQGQSVYHLDAPDVCFSQSRLGHRPVFFIKNHDYFTNINFVYRHNSSLQASFESLMLMHGVRDLVKDWKTNYRYCVSPVFSNKTEVDNFIDFCEKLFTLIISSL